MGDVDTIGGPISKIEKENKTLESELKEYSTAAMIGGLFFIAGGLAFDLYHPNTISKLFAGGGVGMLLTGAHFYNLPSYIKTNKKDNNPQ